MWTSTKALLIATALIGLLTPLFWLTELDLQVSSFFYQYGPNWPLGEHWFYYAFYKGIPWLTTSMGLVLLTVIISASRMSRIRHWRKPAAIALLAFIIGPGLIVNALFKENWGRPRPRAVEQFNGAEQYIPPMMLNQCGDGKSFSCGHCSVGFAFIVFAMLSRRRRNQRLLLALTVGLSIPTSLARIAAGGHFASDALWSAYFTFIAAWFCIRLVDDWLPRLKGSSAARFLPQLSKISLGLAGTLVIASLILFPMTFEIKQQFIVEDTDRINLICTFDSADVSIVSDYSLTSAVEINGQFDTYGAPWSKIDLSFEHDRNQIACKENPEGFFSERHGFITITYHPDKAVVTIDVEKGTVKKQQAE